MTEETLQAAEDVVIDSESAPEGSEPEETEEAHDQQEAQPQEADKADDGGTPEWLQKRIDHYTFKFREEERKRQAVEAELQKYQQQHPQDTAPEIPPLPDEFDPDFREKLAARDKAIEVRTEWNTRQALKAAVERRQMEQQQQEAQKQFAEKERAYVERARKLGVSVRDLEQAGVYVGSFLNPGVAEFILESEQGPLVTTYLARNPDKLQQVASMHPLSAAAYIASQIAPNVAAKPKSTNAPPPPETLGGGGTPPADDGPEGAVYE